MKSYKNKIWIMFWCILSVLILLVGCGKQVDTTKNQEDQEEEKQYADENFIDDMSSGLQARWKQYDEDIEKEGYEDILVNSEENEQMMISYIDAELKFIEKYSDEKFENNNLKELAIKYINLLNQHKDICKYITVDYSKYEEELTSVFNERSKVISQMVNDYGMTVSEDYQNTLEEFLVNSNLVDERESQERAIEEMLNAVTFEMFNDDGYGLKTYQGIIENTTGIDFNNMSFNINLLDGDGVIVETTYDQISAFAKGAKARCEIITDKDFSFTQISASWWE